MGLQTRLNRFLTCLSPDLPLRGYLKPMLNMKRKWLATEVSLWEVNKPTTRNASLVFRVVRRERLCTCWKARQKETSASRVWYTSCNNNNHYNNCTKYCKLCVFVLLHRNNPLVLGTNNSNLPRILQIFGDLFVNDVLSDDEAVRKRVLAIIRQIQVSWHLQSTW